MSKGPRKPIVCVISALLVFGVIFAISSFIPPTKKASAAGATIYVNNTGSTYTDPDSHTWAVGNDGTCDNTGYTKPCASITTALLKAVANDTMILSPGVYSAGTNFAQGGFNLKAGMTFRGADQNNKTVIDGANMGNAGGGSAGTAMINVPDGVTLKWLKFYRAGAGTDDSYNASFFHYALGSAGTTPTITVTESIFSKNYRGILLNGQNNSTWNIYKDTFDSEFNYAIHSNTNNINLYTLNFYSNILTGQLYPTSRTTTPGNYGFYLETASASTLNIYDNTLIGLGQGVRTTNTWTGTANIRNNYFSGNTGINIGKGTSGIINESYNAFSGCSASTVNNFAGNMTGLTADPTDLTTWVHPKTARSEGWLTLRFDDKASENVGKREYYIATADMFNSYGLKATYGFNVGGMTAQDWTDAAYLLSKGQEISSHSYSHMSLDNAVGSPHHTPFTVTIPAGSSLTVSGSGTPPSDTVQIAITVGADTLTITYPSITLNYDGNDNLAQYTTSGSITGKPYAAYNLGVLGDNGTTKGLRDYLNDLGGGWSASTITGAGTYAHRELTLARGLVNVSLTNGSSQNVSWDPSRVDFWEMKYPKTLLETKLGVPINTFIYPNYQFDATAKAALLSYGYKIALGDGISTDGDVWDASHVDMFDIVTTLLNSYKSYSDDDLRKRFESSAEVISESHKVFSFMAHVSTDFSVAQWTILASELAKYTDRLNIVTGNELGNLITTNGLWTTADGGLTYRRTDWTEYDPIWDFHLLPTSPAIDAGVDLNINTDYAGKQRYDMPGVTNTGSAGAFTKNYVDIGAYEYVTPPDPTLSSSTHPSQSTYYNNNTPQITVSPASSTTSYNYLINQTAAPAKSAVAAGTADADGSFTVAAGTITSDGVWYAHIIAKNLDADSSNNYSSYTINYDSTAPSTPGTPATSTPTNNNKPTWAWTASTDSGSGLADPAYSVQWCGNSGFTGCDTNTSTSNTNSFTQPSSLTDGTWYFRVKTSDVVGNNSSYSGNGSVVVGTSVTPTPIPTPSPAATSTATSTPTESATATTHPWWWRLFYGTAKTTTSPSASFTTIPADLTDIEVGQTITFDATSSGSNISIYEWNFGDGDVSNEMKIEHKYDAPGRYTVTLTITDKSGNTSTMTKTVDIRPPAPTISDIKADGTSINFEGKSFPKTTVSLTIHSNPYTGQAIADKDGKFSYVVENGNETLGEGDHTALASAAVILSDNTQLKSKDSKTYDFKVSVDNGKLKIEMKKTRIWQYISLGLILIIAIGFVLYRVRKNRKK